eukprot:12303510-Prorocentrum_lima.AAC.1
MHVPMALSAILKAVQLLRQASLDYGLKIWLQRDGLRLQGLPHEQIAAFLQTAGLESTDRE